MQAMKQIGGLHWAYFKKDSAVLLDKIYKFEDTTFELGGAASSKIFKEKETIAVHTTCYEQKSKVMGLKVRPFHWFVWGVFMPIYADIITHVYSEILTCMHMDLYTYIDTYTHTHSLVD